MNKANTNMTDRQLEIIRAAGRILTVSGVGGLTTKNLAKEMNFSESAIYRHFSGKEEIIVTMLDLLANAMDVRFSEVIDKRQAPDRQIEAMFQAQFSFFKENPYFVVAVFSDGLMEESELINKTILQIMQVKMKHLMPLIKDGQKNGLFTNTISTEDLTQIVMGTFRLQMFKWRLNNFEFDIEVQGGSMLKSILTLLKGNR